MSYRTANLQILHFIYYSTNVLTEYFKHAAHSPFFSLQNAVYFIMVPFLVSVAVVIMLVHRYEINITYLLTYSMEQSPS